MNNVKAHLLRTGALALCLACAAPLAGLATETEAPAEPPAVVTPAPQETSQQIPQAPAQQTPAQQAPAQQAPAQQAPRAIPQFQQEADREWQRLQEVWDALPKNKKEQLYKAMEGVDKADLNFIKKAAELQLLSPEAAESMRDYIKGRTARIREDGGLPMYRKNHK